MEMITSFQNSKIKNLNLLIEKNKERNIQNRFVVEGHKEINLAIKGKYTLLELYCCEELCNSKIEIFKSTQYVSINRAIFSKIAYRENSDGVIGVFKKKDHSLTTLEHKDIPLYIVLESVEKPGNLGAIARTVDAVGADGLIVCSPLCDIYNPNTIRSSVGTLFSIPIVLCSPEEWIEYCIKHNISIYPTYINQLSTEYYNCDYSTGTAIIFGTEHSGLSDIWIELKNIQCIKIPMLGINDSLNVSVAVGVIAYEIIRQRTNIPPQVIPK